MMEFNLLVLHHLGILTAGIALGCVLFWVYMKWRG